MQPATLGGGGGSSALTIGTTTITGGATTQVMINLGGVVSSSSQLTFSTTGGPSGGALLGIGTPGASAGFKIGTSQSGFGGIWGSNVTASSSNFILQADDAGSSTYINASSNVILMIGASEKMRVSSGGIYLTSNTKLTFGVTAPTVASGGCTSPTAVTSNGTASFSVGVGTSCSGSQPLVFTLPAATRGWTCTARNETNGATSSPAQSGALSTTSVTITNYSRTLGTAAAWTDADVVTVTCVGG